MRVRWLHKLSVKLILVISVILLTNLAIYIYLTVSRLESDLTQAYAHNAYSISEVIKNSTRYSMLLNRREDVYHIINTVGQEEDIVGIRIYNKSGRITFSTDKSETQRIVDINAEACVICHTTSKIFSAVPVRERTRIYTAKDGKKVMGLINPIRNEQECATGGCHVHPADMAVLGVLDVVLSMDRMEKIIGSNTNNIICNAMIVTLIISLCCAFFINVMLNHPVRQINQGIMEIGKGNLSYRIALDTDDELGRIAHRFNEMANKLDTAYKEITVWSETLNTKVNEKTEELKKIYDQVIRIEKMASLGQLSATVAHELNNPLEGILTYSKLIARQLQKIQKGNEYDETLRYLSMISDESLRCGRIVKDLLTFSHRDEEVFIPENAHRLVQKSLALVRHHLQMHRIDVEEKYYAVHSLIMCHPGRIQQALLALLMNAIEAMHGLNGKLTIETKSDNLNLFIYIKDTGSGIQPKDLPHIFEPFYTTKTEGKGTGLGLAVVYGIVNHHNGRVIVENTSPAGTVFRIALPLLISMD